ncbi:MAG: PVC-type heme-binding CxxCH protein, partial [Planctomycetota bacterium]
MRWLPPAALTMLPLLSSCTGSDSLADFAFTPGDRVCLIGNTLADRMQHHGWLETLLQSRLSDEKLSFRNLGYSGDELELRLRSKNFGSPDEHLAHSKADVVFAFFGYNESFAGEEGLPKFREDLGAFISHTLEQKYNGESPPRLVLFSPIAHEDLGTPDLPNGSENNARLEKYTAAMTEVAAERKVPFVDLFASTRQLYGRELLPLTINGIHLNEMGNRMLAETIVATLLPEPAQSATGGGFQGEIRAAVLDKNLHWFNRYRTTDGYSIFGDRGELAFVDGQTNREVIDRELEILDVMTANRDQMIWAAAKGEDLYVSDDNTPEFLEVKTNKPGGGPEGAHEFLSGEEAISKMTVAKGMAINLFASEEQFPELVNPNQTAMDTQGRLWVSAWPTYPHWQPKGPMNDKLLILPDDDGDGRADRCIVFADDLHNPTGFEFWGGGVIVAQIPDLLFLQDTDGDDRADVRIRLLHGIDSADTHHAINSFVLGPGGDLYFQEGTFHHTQVETPYGPPVRNANAGVFRYDPRTQDFEVYTAYNFANPHGHVFDRWGQDFVTDGTGSQPYLGASFSGRTIFPQKHARAPQVYQQRTRPCPGTIILSSSHFPDELQGNWLVGNVIGFQGILQYQFADDGSGFTAKEVEPIVHSSDPNFRPTDMEIGKDGALYFSEWQNPIIGHMQHNLRDPSRDKLHGRVYRVTYPERPLLEAKPIAGESTADLVALLADPDDPIRYRARIELSDRTGDEVIPALQSWMASLAEDDPEYEHRMAEALWMHQAHNRLNMDLLARQLRAKDPRARAAATRVLCVWRERIPNFLELLATQVRDEHPRVRLEAVRACSFSDTSLAAEIALEAVNRPLDRFLSYTLNETIKTLRPQWLAALGLGEAFAADNPKG